jgi:hypothetical protein
VTVTDFVALTPSPVQVRVNVVVEVMAAVVAEPVVACVPLQPPVAEHAVAFSELHVKLTVAPEVTDVVPASRLTTGPDATLKAYVPAPAVPG